VFHEARPRNVNTASPPHLWTADKRGCRIYKNRDSQQRTVIMHRVFDPFAARTERITLTLPEVARYSRHLIMPEVALDGQKRLKASRVLLIGAGGLGSPLGLYLAAAGIGRIGLVDFDVVDFSNLQRQILHGTPDVGRPKLQSAKDRLNAINPEVQIDLYETKITSANAMKLCQPYDIIIDG